MRNNTIAICTTVHVIAILFLFKVELLGLQDDTNDMMKAMEKDMQELRGAVEVFRVRKVPSSP